VFEERCGVSGEVVRGCGDGGGDEPALLAAAHSQEVFDSGLA
jgi:hypothetical protein